MTTTLTAAEIPARALDLARRALRIAAATGVGVSGECADLRDIAEAFTPGQFGAATALLDRAGADLQYESRFVELPAPEAAFSLCSKAVRKLEQALGNVRFGHVDVLTRHLSEVQEQLDRAESLVREDPAELGDQSLVEAAIRASGFGVARFAHEVMAGRDERTIRRWRSGESPLPAQTRAWIEEWLAAE